MLVCAKVANFAPNKATLKPMKRLLALIILTLATLHIECRAQSVIVGDRLPDLHLRRWLMDIQPDQSDYTCLLFHHSESEVCRQSLRSIAAMVEEYDTALNLVIITKEDYDKAGVTLTEYLDDRVGVAFDEGGRAFRALKVSFIPFCVVCDKHRRVVWCGNGNTLTHNVMDKILTSYK